MHNSIPVRSSETLAGDARIPIHLYSGRAVSSRSVPGLQVEARKGGRRRPEGRMVGSMSGDTPAGVIDAGLWERVSAAFPAVNAAIDQYLAAGGWVPSASVPVMAQFDTSGWPHMQFPATPGSEVPDYSRLFGLAAGNLRPFSYSGIPELAAVINYVIGRADLVERFDVVPESAQVPDGALWFVRLQAAGLVLSVVDRARALGRPYDRETLLAAYRERERGLLAAELDANLVAPLVLTRLDLSAPLDLGDGVRLEKLDEAIQLARARDSNPVGAVPLVVAGAATHAVVITGVTIDNSSLADRMWRGSAPSLPFAELDLAVECLRVVTRAPTGYAQVFLRPAGWADQWTHALPPVVDVGVFHRYPASFDNYGWLKKPTLVSADQLAALPGIVRSARNAGKTKQGKPARLALRRLSLAGLRDDDDDTLVDACIGIEALLSNDNIEITHKIAMRGAAALATRSAEPLDPQKAFAMLKAVYGRRSDLVHGTGKDNKAVFDLDGRKVATSALAVFLLRKLLLSRLTSDPAWTIQDLDDELLVSLTRGIADQAVSPSEHAPAGSPDQDQQLPAAR